jgi:hypothetical protein
VIDSNLSGSGRSDGTAKRLKQGGGVNVAIGACL